MVWLLFCVLGIVALSLTVYSEETGDKSAGALSWLVVALLLGIMAWFIWMYITDGRSRDDGAIPTGILSVIGLLLSAVGFFCYALYKLS